MDIPVLEDSVVKKVSISIRVFGTNQKGLIKGQNFLGISPGPESLSQYSMFHLYKGLGDENPIANMMLTVDAMDDYTNWDQ